MTTHDVESDGSAFRPGVGTVVDAPPLRKERNTPEMNRRLPSIHAPRSPSGPNWGITHGFHAEGSPIVPKLRETSSAYAAFARGRSGLDARELRRVQTPNDFRLLGMPVPVWTLAMWFTAALVVDAASFVIPASSNSPLWPRVAAAGYASIAVAVMVALADRTPTWFVHVQLVLSVAFMAWFTATAASSAGSLTAMMIMIVLAGYTAYTLPYLQAMAYVAASAVAFLAALVVAEVLDALFLPWVILTAICLAQVMILGVLVSNLKRQVVIDPLTGLLNRAGLEYATSAPGRYSALDQPRSILVMDLDGFKAVNDQGGHAAGDKVLQQVGEAILRVCRKDDLPVRCGGDEFILVLPHTDESGAARLAARLNAEVLAPCSIGVAAWGPDEELHHAIGRADDRMYQDKARRKQLGAH